MRFVRYGDAGAERPGCLESDGALRDLGDVVGDLAGPVLGNLPKVDPQSLPRVAGNPRLGPPVTDVGKIVCIGLNYSDHAAEMNLETPFEPVIFLKATSAINGPYDPIILPRGSQKGDWEVELAIVIGKTAKYVPEDTAMDHIAGYTIMNDVTERALQNEGTGQWTKGKSCDSFAPLGPWLVTPDEVGDPHALQLGTTVSGEEMQRGSTSLMIFRVPHLVSFVSNLMTLHPGDIIATGTPPGIGMGQTPPRFLRDGDVLELMIEGLGTQRNEVRAG